jgi:hypothetical protein
MPVSVKEGESHMAGKRPKQRGKNYQWPNVGRVGIGTYSGRTQSPQLRLPKYSLLSILLFY